MTRRSAVLASCLLALVLLPAAPAVAGGGCHEGVTQGRGDTVELVEACPTPTILRLDPGDTVTFVNKDPFAHNIIGIGWGHYDDLNQGDTFTATFDKPGVYPYACWIHPGMTGAVVVGNGRGAGSGGSVSVASYRQPSPAAAVRGADEGRDPAGTRTGWVVGAALGVVVGLAIAGLTRRAPRPAPEPEGRP